MAGISLMYKLSGGCDYHHYCGECTYLKKETEKVGFGKTYNAFYCTKHPDGGKWWKQTYTACHHFRKKTRLKESSNGQWYFAFD